MLQRQLAHFGTQGLQINRRRFGFRRFPKHLDGAFCQPFLPIDDLILMNLEFLGQLSKGFISYQGG
ncbi:hypothetical protein [Methylomonas sp. DH-1]|uniref:hypothetical protein n=1 Tax=Methylomonas sp. (strain DH-1) TaxID=1727196 RepID=UPI0007C8D02E|nr:hypothetical protein [Methylomonas sp. DH-1]ANE54593.1 hypothetical protein AYM39_04905 [Methylomonas sp. DH-1]